MHVSLSILCQYLFGITFFCSPFSFCHPSLQPRTGQTLLFALPQHACSSLHPPRAQLHRFQSCHWFGERANAQHTLGHHYLAEGARGTNRFGVHINSWRRGRDGPGSQTKDKVLLPASREQSRRLQGLNLRSPGLSLAALDSRRQCYQMVMVQAEPTESTAEMGWMWLRFLWAPRQRGAQLPRLAGAVEVENA